MSASVAVRGLFRMSRPGRRRIETSERALPSCDWDVRVESIGNILRRDGYTIAQLSAASLRRYGSRSPYFIPATFLYQLRRGITPHVCQIVALSESTGYRFVDWMRICGFDLQNIPRMQMRLHSERTVLVTPIEDSIQPLSPQPFRSHFREWGGAPCPFGEEWSGRRRYLFARIGTRDAALFPQFPAGSMVRVDRHYAHRIRSGDHVSMRQLLWLVEQSSGLTCSRVKWIDDRQIVLLPSRPPWGLWPLRLPTEARILGLVDMDAHPRAHVKLQSTAGIMNLHRPFPPPFVSPHPTEEGKRFSDLLRISRARAGLTFRAAHQLTRAMGQILARSEYAVALGMLSDYEAMGRLPRHVAKILSLCAVYCMDFRDLMKAAGVHIDDSAKLPLSIFDDRLQPSPEPHRLMSLGTGDIVTGYARAASAQS